MKITRETLTKIIQEELNIFLEANPAEIPVPGEQPKEYPNASTMKRLVTQALKAKKNIRFYDPEDDAQLVNDYDEHVRDTLRDPKYSQAHKRN